MIIKREKLYWVFCVCFTTYWFIHYLLQNLSCDLSFFKNTFLIIGVFCFFLEWLYTKFTFKEYLIQAIFLLFLGYVYVKSGMNNEGILTFFPAIIGLKNIDIKKSIKVIFKTLLILEIIVIIGTILGIIPSTYYIKTDKFGNSYSIFEMAMMHGNPNYIVIFNLVVMYIYIYYEKINIKRCLILQLILLVAYFVFYCKTGIILGSLAIWGTLVIKKVSKRIYNYKIVTFLFGHSYAIFYAFVYILAKYMYDTKIFELINKVVQSRIYEAYYYITNIGVGLLPKQVNYYYICDNSQTVLLVNFGLIFTLIYIYIHDKAIRNLLKKGLYIEVFIMCLYLLYSYSETTFIKPFSNFSAIFLIYVFYKNGNDLNDKKK